MQRLFYIGIILYLIASCSNGNFKETEINQFIGTWELKGRDVFEGIQIKIEANEKGKLKGRIIQLNDNKWVKQFVDTNDVFITKIERLSNFEFEVSEKKIASELFGMYDLPTKELLKMKFVSPYKIQVVGKKKICYKRIK